MGHKIEHKPKMIDRANVILNEITLRLKLNKATAN